jgi:hypothetical protein
MACFGFVTFLPLRPDLSLPRFISRISVSTFLPADGEYLRRDDFLAVDFWELDFFVVAFFVAITILLGGQMVPVSRQVVWVAASRSVCEPDIVGLDNAPNTRNAHQRIGDEPCCNTRKRAGDCELKECGRNPWMKQQADADQHRRMNDVDRVGAAVEP